MMEKTIDDRLLLALWRCGGECDWARLLNEVDPPISISELIASCIDLGPASLYSYRDDEGNLMIGITDDARAYCEGLECDICGEPSDHAGWCPEAGGEAA